MDAVIDGLAVLAFVGVVLLMFATSALLKIVRELQSVRYSADAGVVAELRSIAELARGDGRFTCVLAVTASCTACRERARYLVEAAQRADVGLALLTADEACRDWAVPPVTVFVDSALMGRVGVTATPTLLLYDDEGRELWRRIVGSDAELDALFARAHSEMAAGAALPPGPHADSIG